MATSETKLVLPAQKIGIWHCAVVLFSQVPKNYTDLDLILLYSLILRTYCKFTRKCNFQCSAFAFRSPDRALAAGLPRQDHVCKTTDELSRFHSKKFDEMPCKLDCTENPSSFESCWHSCCTCIYSFIRDMTHSYET